MSASASSPWVRTISRPPTELHVFFRESSPGMGDGISASSPSTILTRPMSDEAGDEVEAEMAKSGGICDAQPGTTLRFFPN